MEPSSRRLRPGALQSIVAMLAAVLTAVVVTLSATAYQREVVQLAGFGLLLYCAAVVFGARLMLGATSVVVLGAALIEPIATSDSSWVRSLVVGCLWYVTLELGWDALERSDGGDRRRNVIVFRIHEVASVVAVALLIGLVAVAASSLAPTRTIVVQAAALLTALTVLVTAITRLRATA